MIDAFTMSTGTGIALTGVVGSITAGIVSIVKAIRAPEPSQVASKALSLATAVSKRMDQVEKKLKACDTERQALQKQVTALSQQVENK